MDNEYCMEGTTEGIAETGSTKVLGKVRNCAKSKFINPMYITFIILFISIEFMINWYYVRYYVPYSGLVDNITSW